MIVLNAMLYFVSVFSHKFDAASRKFVALKLCLNKGRKDGTDKGEISVEEISHNNIKLN